MLLGTIHAFVAAFYVDALPIAAAVAGIAFAWMWYFIGTESVASYWIAWSPGLAVAAVARWRTRRLLSLSLLPSTTATPRQMLAAVFVVFAFTWYTLRIEDPASALIEPFPIGAVLSLLIVTPVLIVLEIADHVGTNETAPAFQPISTHWNAWLALCGIVAVDMIAWRHSWLLVIVGGGAMVALAGVAQFMPRVLR